VTEPVATPVLIVGAGPVGLSMALLLARFDIPCVIVERGTERGRHPKARGVRTRTMELFRQWGIADELRPSAQTTEALRFIYCDSLIGEEIGRSPQLDPPSDAITPVETYRIPQEVVEDVLLQHVLDGPSVVVRRGVELVGIEQHESDVDATLRTGDGDLETMRARYVIGADGVGSTVRATLGIGLTGIPVIAYWQSVHWRADISDLTTDRPCIQFLTGARSGAFVGVAWNRDDRWVTILQRPGADERPDALTSEQATQVIREAVGRPQLEVEILDSTTFRIGAEIAERYREGRVFLVGDAAHSMPPTGGFGMNTGIQDAHNLAWRLAYVIHGAAGEEVLDGYDEERRPIAQANAAWSVSNAKRMRELRDAIAGEDADRLASALLDQIHHVGALGQDLGFRYRSGTLLDDGADAPPLDPIVYEPSATPGGRAPHLWVEQEGSRISTLDLFDRSYVLLAPAGGREWTAAARRLAAELAIPLDAYVVGIEGDLVADGDGFAALYGISGSGAVLVRPDGHVAWRSAALRGDPAAALADVLARLHVVTKAVA
jgi:2-polyprenyl-6-methoxyphenol hydroxylase-like FAD-dependent oxidoreductase